MRYYHYLKENHRLEMPTQMVFVDTETKPEQVTPKMERHTLWFGWACYNRLRNKNGTSWTHEEWKDFETPHAFWEWLTARCRNKSRTWVFAHNWNFDAGILWAATIPLQMGYSILEYVNGKPPFWITYRKGTKTIVLIDTLNYFAGSLASIAKSIGMEKLKMPSRKDNLQSWKSYGMVDVKIIQAAMFHFRDFLIQHDLGNFQRTLASQAMTAYRHRFMKHRILIHADKEVCELERLAYKGGRVECFYLGEVKDDLYYLDVNSMYPFIMRNKPMPIHLGARIKNASLSRLNAALERKAVVATCLLNTDIPYYPIVRDGRLIFPIGTFTASLTTPELKFASDHGHILKISDMAVYDQAPIFTEYVDTLYNLRLKYKEQGNATFAYMCKIMLNSLYGKFGQSGRKWENVGEVTEGDPFAQFALDTPDSPIIQFRIRLGMLQRLAREGESENSFPAIAAHVTGYARAYLWELITQAGEKNVYYVDTDSLIVNRTGYLALVNRLDPVRLGALKRENMSTHATFHGAKDYVFGDWIKRKGVRTNAIEVSPNTFEQDKFTSWDYMLSQATDGCILIEKIRKTLKREYLKGTPTPSGWVKPFVMDEKT